MQSAGVVPMNPTERGQLDIGDGFPRAGLRRAHARASMRPCARLDSKRRYAMQLPFAARARVPCCLSTSRPNLRWCSSGSLSAEREADSGYPPAISHILWSYDMSTRTT